MLNTGCRSRKNWLIHVSVQQGLHDQQMQMSVHDLEGFKVLLTIRRSSPPVLNLSTQNDPVDVGNHVALVIKPFIHSTGNHLIGFGWADTVRHRIPGISSLERLMFHLDIKPWLQSDWSICRIHQKANRFELTVFFFETKRNWWSVF